MNDIWAIVVLCLLIMGPPVIGTAAWGMGYKRKKLIASVKPGTKWVEREGGMDNPFGYADCVLVRRVVEVREGWVRYRTYLRTDPGNYVESTMPIYRFVRSNGRIK